MSKLLEKQIEERVNTYAKEHGVMVYKFTSPARAAVPDRLYVYHGKVWFIEFKREGKSPTPAQEREHDRLREHDIDVFVVDNVEFGKKVIDRYANT